MGGNGQPGLIAGDVVGQSRMCLQWLDFLAVRSKLPAVRGMVLTGQRRRTAESRVRVDSSIRHALGL
jgi:hypothetical protein